MVEDEGAAHNSVREVADGAQRSAARRAARSRDLCHSRMRIVARFLRIDHVYYRAPPLAQLIRTHLLNAPLYFACKRGA